MALFDDDWIASNITNDITGTRIKKRYLSYWLSFPIEFVGDRAPHFFLNIFMGTYMLSFSLLYYFLLDSFFALFFSSGFTNLFTGISFLFSIWLIERSNEKYKLELNNFQSLIKNKYFEEYKLYRYFFLEALNNKPENENIYSSETMNETYNFESYFARAEKEANIKITYEEVVFLFRIHFNTDYHRKHNYSTKAVHPFFCRLLKIFKKKHGSFFY
jgi:hypothetical protein